MKQKIIIDLLTDFFKADTKRVKGAVLMGSFGRGQGTPSSDVDIELWIDQTDFDRENFIHDIVQLFPEKDSTTGVKHTIWLNDQHKLALYHGSDLLLTELYLYSEQQNIFLNFMRSRDK